MDKKSNAGAKKKPLKELTYTLSVMVKGATLEKLGDELKPKMLQEDMMKTKNTIYKFLNELP